MKPEDRIAEIRGRHKMASHMSVEGVAAVTCLVAKDVPYLLDQLARARELLERAAEAMEGHAEDGSKEHGMEIGCAIGFQYGEAIAEEVRAFLEGGGDE